MALDNSTIPQQVLNALAMGLMSEQGAAVDALPGRQRFEVTDLGGTVPVLPSASTLANKVSATGVAEGADPDEFDVALDDVSYILKRYPGYSTITQGNRVSAEGKGLQVLRTIMQRAQMQSNAQVDALLNAMLSSTTYNEAQAAANGAWDVSTSTPLADMLAGKRKVGGRPNLGVIGDDILKDLQVHPDFIARTSSFDAGAVSEAEIARIIRDVLGLDMMMVGNRLYNSAVEGATTVTLAYQFDGLFWIGHAQDIVVVEQMESPRSEMGRSVRREADEIIFTRRVDILRPHKEMGVVFTGIET